MLTERFSQRSRRRRCTSVAAASTIFAISAIASCTGGDGLKRQPVSGLVTCDGKPLAAAAILFEPATYQSGTAVGAMIRNGGFAISEREGPVPGSYKVRIYMSSGSQAPPGKNQTERSSRPMAEFLPEEYNSKTKLRADVSESRPNRFRFELSSKPSAGAQ